MLPLRFPKLWLAGGILILALTLVLALAPLGRSTTLDVLTDKGAHFLAFTGLMVWFCGVFRLRLTVLVAIGLLGFGILIELLQSRLPYRTAEMADVIFDGGGIVTGWLMAVAGLRHWTAWVETRLVPDPRP